MFRIIYPAIRWLGWGAVLLYVLVALAILSTRYLIFPNVNQYKSHIEAQLSSLLDSRVDLGHLNADWHYLNPQVEIEQIVLRDSNGVEVLTIPRLTAVVSWHSLWTLTPQFVSLHARGVDLSVRRDQDKRLWLLGRSITDESDDEMAATLGDRTVRWLASQPQIRLYDSSIRWNDESRDGSSLLLQDVNFKIRNREQQHQFSIDARPAAPVGGRFDMRGNFTRSQDHERPLALETGHGQLYLHIEDMHPGAWQAWIDWPEAVQSEKVSAQAWLELAQGEALDVTVDVRTHGTTWRGHGEQGVQGQFARFYARGPWTTFQNVVFASPELRRLDVDASERDEEDSMLMAMIDSVRDTQAKSGLPAALDFMLEAQDLQVYLPQQYAQPIEIGTFRSAGTAQHVNDAWSFQLRDIRMRNDDIDVAGRLGWSYGDGPGPGVMDADVRVYRADLAAVHRYMPDSLDSDVKEWLQHGLLAGHVHDAHVRLRGNLSQFPFEQPGVDGEFRIRGAFQDAVIDYLPEDEQSKGWPRLDAVHGRIDLNRASLRVHSAVAQIRPGDAAVINLEQIDAYIDNLREDAVLQVSGDTHGDGTAYTTLLRESDLSDMLNGVFDHTVAQGAWEVPLLLTVPLARGEDTTVEGDIRIDEGRIQFEPDLPSFDTVRGTIHFTQDLVSISSLSARFLNENVQVSGGIGPGQPGLRMAGRISAEGTREIMDTLGMQRFSGSTNYVALLTGVGKGLDEQHAKLEITSDLQGIALDFPPPLDKPADAAWPLRIVWSHGDGAGTRWLDVALRDSMRGRFVHHQDASSASYFQAGNLGVGRVAEWSDSGLNVDIEHPVFDGDAWNAITQEFVGTEHTDNNSPLFPRIHNLRLQTQSGRLLGLPLDELTYTVKRQTQHDWRADISSTQTAGTLTWREEGGKVQGPVQAVFHRLAYGSASRDKTSSGSSQEVAPQPAERSVTDDLRIPAINLIIENFSMYGRQVGKLALVGVNEDRGDTWRLEQFALSSPSMHLEGRGVWRLRGEERGLTLDANADVSDLGDYTDQIGFQDMLSGGAGQVKGKIYWHDLPWTFDVNNIDGDISFEFSKGRLSTINSKSARLLELISLQSIRRLATLDLNPLNLTHDGFPYDVVRGSLRLEHGKVYTEDYRLTGPVGTIVLDGQVYLSSGDLDLQAVVVPNLDVSGAAVAAGVAINPVVGIGAFLTQWLLKGPLAAAMTAQYQIKGDWDQPEILPVDRITENSADAVEQ